MSFEELDDSTIGNHETAIVKPKKFVMADADSKALEKLGLNDQGTVSPNKPTNFSADRNLANNNLIESNSPKNTATQWINSRIFTDPVRSKVGLLNPMETSVWRMQDFLISINENRDAIDSIEVENYEKGTSSYNVTIHLKNGDTLEKFIHPDMSQDKTSIFKQSPDLYAGTSSQFVDALKNMKIDHKLVSQVHRKTPSEVNQKMQALNSKNNPPETSKEFTALKEGILTPSYLLSYIKENKHKIPKVEIVSPPPDGSEIQKPSTVVLTFQDGTTKKTMVNFPFLSGDEISAISFRHALPPTVKSSYSISK